MQNGESEKFYLSGLESHHILIHQLPAEGGKRQQKRISILWQVDIFRQKTERERLPGGNPREDIHNPAPVKMTVSGTAAVCHILVLPL